MSRNTPRLLCMFVIIPLAHGSAESVDQSADGVCSFQGLSTPTEKYSDEYGAVWLSPGHAHFSAVETRPVPHLCGLNRPAPSGRNGPLDSERWGVPPPCFRLFKLCEMGCAPSLPHLSTTLMQRFSRAEPCIGSHAVLTRRSFDKCNYCRRTNPTCQTAKMSSCFQQATTYS